MANRIPKWFLIFAAFGLSGIVLALALLGRSCFTQGFTGQLMDTNGSPLQGAFVLFIYKNDSLNPGGANEHAFASGFLETDENGQFHIPARFYFFIPLFQTSLQPWVEVAYSPKTHSCVSANAFHESYNDLEMNVHKVTLSDSSNDLQQRAGALESLIDAMDFRIVAPPEPVAHLKATPGLNERLVSTLHSEYDFLYPKLFPESSPPKTPYLSASNVMSSHFISMRRSQFLSLRLKIESYENEMKMEQQKK